MFSGFPSVDFDSCFRSAIGRGGSLVADSLPSCDGGLGVQNKDGALFSAGLVYSRASPARRDRGPGSGSPPAWGWLFPDSYLNHWYTSSARVIGRATETRPALSGEEDKVSSAA